ncbi:MAG TPA: prohibitin family protein [Bryobacteraceae bacterium]|nr:prohibitin family protein [Bryobacteraceae bacterium]
MALKTEFRVDGRGNNPDTPERDTPGEPSRNELRVLRWRRRWTLLKGTAKTLVVLLLVGMFLWVFRERMFFSVNSGEVLLVFYRLFGGTSHNQIGREGLHIIAPWDKAYRYSIRTQTMLVPMTVLASDGLEIRLQAQIRFNAVPETVPYLHRRYGPNYVTDLIVPQLTESVQAVIGQFRAEELYSFQRAASMGRILERARRLVGGVYVHVDDLALFNISLPPKVQDAIQNKVAADQDAQAHAFMVLKEKQEAMRKEIEAGGLARYAAVASKIPREVLIWKGIEATLELAKSPNAKIIVMGNKDNLPLLLGNVPDVTAK